MDGCDPDFDCGDKICVPMETVCDGFFDCENYSDESKCGDSSIFVFTIIALIFVAIILVCVVIFRQKKNVGKEYNATVNFLNAKTENVPEDINRE